MVVGYGATAVDALRHLHAPDFTADLVVMDLDALALAAAMANGARALHGDGRDLCDLRYAGVAFAARVIIAVPDDLDGLLIALAVRSLTRTVALVAVVRDRSNCDQFTRAGVDEVLVGLPGEERSG